MFDSLNRHMLPSYGCDWVKAPNFARLATRTVSFDKSFVGSMPCMPARRELHTGRYNFLHRSWGPLEPFDDSMPGILGRNNIYTHLVSDHYHYWEDGGGTYHNRYRSWEMSRGQEGDAWKGAMNSPVNIKHPNVRLDRGADGHHDWVNRSHMQNERDQPQAKTFAMGCDFIKENHDNDKWFLQIETFDPHEPYFTNKNYQDLYPHDYDGDPCDWPSYSEAREDENDLTDHFRNLNAALISMCDNYLGKVLDLMDKHDMWKDTMLIVNTDHGFLLGEHDWWGKCVMPFYNEVANTPFFIWDPRSGKCNQRRKSLVQTIDIAPTLLEFFDIDVPPDMQGVPLRETIASDKPVREAGLYGIHGGHVNCTDGRYVYMRAPVSNESGLLYNYTHMPTHMNGMFRLSELQSMTVSEPFSFTKGCPLMKIDAGNGSRSNAISFGTMLFDLEKDPKQEHPLDDPDVEKMMCEHLVRLMKENDAPEEQYRRLGLGEGERESLSADYADGGMIWE